MRATDRREERAKMAAASFALVLSLPVLFALLLFNPHHLKDWTRTRTRREGWQTVEALPCFLLAAGRSVAMWWRLHRPEMDEVAALHLALVAGATVARW